jgi:hypothetical protein
MEFPFFRQTATPCTSPFRPLDGRSEVAYGRFAKSVNFSGSPPPRKLKGLLNCLKRRAAVIVNRSRASVKEVVGQIIRIRVENAHTA